VTYLGREAHASAFPQLGINGADALTVAQVAVGLLRQHIEPSMRIHGIVTHGGDAPNIVPGRTTGSWYVRAATLAVLEDLSPRVRACFEAGALATGCELEVVRKSPPYSEFLPDATLLAAYAQEATAIGRVFPTLDPSQELAGSTDMANVSLHVPTIHPMLAIAADGAVNHQPGVHRGRHATARPPTGRCSTVRSRWPARSSPSPRTPRPAPPSRRPPWHAGEHAGE
jgi:metal-dependent amidase/aminoacylase/carboxypeptidase family protein